MAACTPNSAGELETKDDPNGTDDIQEALRRLPDATVLNQTADGMPTWVVGELGKVGAMDSDPQLADTALRGSLPPVLAVFRLRTEDLQLRKLHVDEDGGRHFRYTQVKNGLPVIGGDLIVHVDIKGAINGVNGSARGDISDTLGANGISQASAMSVVTNDARFRSLATTGVRPVYLQTDDGALHKAYEATVEGVRGQDPVRDRVFVDMDSSQIVAVHPQIHHARNRRVFTANNGTSLPGTQVRTETQGPVADSVVNKAFDNAGDVYDTYSTMFARDSYDGAGAQMNSTVHYSVNYCNAFWDGSRMVYGDGNASQNCASLANSIDVAGHEITHAVTENESGLIYSGESGGLNESYSDIFGAFTESWVEGGRNGTLSTAAKVFLIGDTVLPPFLRSMCDPAADGASRDVWSSSIGGIDVHFSSGPNNLAFCLLSKGGTHPRGKTTNNVPSIGILKAAQIYYRAQTTFLTPSSNYAAMRTAATQAAVQLGFDQATQDAVGCAFAAISVGTAPASCGGNPQPTETVLQNGVGLSGQSGAAGAEKFYRLEVPAGQSQVTFTISGGTGDADLYVKFGSRPAQGTGNFDCRPFKNGNAETCTFTPASQGTYFVMLHAFTAYSGVTLTGSFGGTPTPTDVLANGVPKTGLSGATGSNTFFRILAVPAGRTLTVKLTGPGTGDADLYTRFGQRPTTSSFACRPFLDGNTETCTHTTTASTAGDWHVMLRGFAAYTGVSLVASF